MPLEWPEFIAFLNSCEYSLIRFSSDTVYYLIAKENITGIIIRCAVVKGSQDSLDLEKRFQ